ncbi:hypothetical protein BDF21DRAFT_486121 [Thamnidium elegans]|nr:hypothetical protein BDF21DRAFT_486121 [Thamnidium elegans]
MSKDLYPLLLITSTTNVSILSWNITTYCRFRYINAFVLHYLYEHTHLLGYVLSVLFDTVDNRYSFQVFCESISMVEPALGILVTESKSIIFSMSSY